jgi:hypothetical protein
MADTIIEVREKKNLENSADKEELKTAEPF